MADECVWSASAIFALANYCRGDPGGLRWEAMNSSIRRISDVHGITAGFQNNNKIVGS